MSQIDYLMGPSANSLQGAGADSLQGVSAGSLQGASADSFQGRSVESLQGTSVSTLIADSVRRLAESKRGSGPLPARPEVGARSSSVGRGRTPSNQSGSGSINETDYSLRTYWPEQLVKSSDGLMVLRIKPIKSIAIEGGQQMTFQQPPTTS